MVRKGALLRLLAIGLIAGLITSAVAYFIDWLPASASEQQDRIEFVYWFATVICIVIFSVVAGWLVYAVIAFRVKPGDDTDGPPIHGHSGLEVAWTAVPALLVIAIGVVTAVVLSRNADAGSNPLHIKVFAQQFAWRFQYPDDGGFTSNELVMPLDRAIKFEMTSADVIHSFWIPEMGQKQDLLPGVETSIVITPTRLGSYTLVCTELCGAGHATMRGPARVVGTADFTAWASKQSEAAGDGGAGGAGPNGAKLFAANGCGGCHTFKPAGSDGQIGPDLDGLAKAAAAAGKEPEEFVKQSIADPNAYLAPGYQGGVMPGTFAKTLKPEEIDALVEYLLGKE